MSTTDRMVESQLLVQQQLCKLRGTSDTFVGRAFSIFHLYCIIYYYLEVILLKESTPRGYLCSTAAVVVINRSLESRLGYPYEV